MRLQVSRKRFIVIMFFGMLMAGMFSTIAYSFIYVAIYFTNEIGGCIVGILSAILIWKYAEPIMTFFAKKFKLIT